MASFRDGATAARVDALFDHAASQRKPAVAVFPTLRTETEVADLLLALAVGERYYEDSLGRLSHLNTSLSKREHGRCPSLAVTGFRIQTGS